MINADPQELAKFSELAHRWWDPDSEFRPLHQINPLRLDWIDERAPLNGKRVLDVGCGGGILAESMARRGADVLGIDLADKPLKVAQLHALEAGTSSVDYREVAAEALARERPAHFDVVTCMEMLEHVPGPGIGGARVRCARASRAVALFFSTHQPQSEGVPVRHRRRRVRAEAAAEGHARIREVHSPERAGALVPRCRTRRVSDTCGLEYNPLTRRYSAVATTPA